MTGLDIYLIIMLLIFLCCNFFLATWVKKLLTNGITNEMTYTLNEMNYSLLVDIYNLLNKSNGGKE